MQGRLHADNLLAGYVVKSVVELSQCCQRKHESECFKVALMTYHTAPESLGPLSPTRFCNLAVVGKMAASDVTFIARDCRFRHQGSFGVLITVYNVGNTGTTTACRLTACKRPYAPRRLSDTPKRGRLLINARKFSILRST